MSNNKRPTCDHLSSEFVKISFNTQFCGINASLFQIISVNQLSDRIGILVLLLDEIDSSNSFQMAIVQKVATLQSFVIIG